MYVIFKGEPRKRPYSVLEYITKGKGKVTGPGASGKRQDKPSLGHLPNTSNPNFADPLPNDDSDDEGESDYIILFRLETAICLDPITVSLILYN